MAANWTAFSAGDVLTAAQLNGVVDNFADIAIFNETQASGTAGGATATGSFIKRTLNTTVVNNITGCSIASSVVTLPAGTFLMYASGPFYQCGEVKIRLQNTTAATTIGYGTNCYPDPAVACNVVSNVMTATTLSVSSTVELQYRAASVRATAGLGNLNGFGGNSEIYSQLVIVRIA
jgi:hypothetical protein